MVSLISTPDFPRPLRMGTVWVIAESTVQMYCCLTISEEMRREDDQDSVWRLRYD